MRRAEFDIHRAEGVEVQALQGLGPRSRSTGPASRTAATAAPASCPAASGSAPPSRRRAPTPPGHWQRAPTPHRVLFADEPTGELDTASGAEVFAAPRRTNAELGVTVLIVTHDPAVAEQVRRTVRIRDGRTATEVLRPSAGGAAAGAAQEAGEHAVLDRVGRLQLPREFTERYGLHRRVRLTAEPDHLGVWPDRGQAARETGHDPDPGAGGRAKDEQEGDDE